MHDPLDAPSNSDDVIDSRDVIERLTELEDEREALQETENEAREEWAKVEWGQRRGCSAPKEELDAASAALNEWDEDNGTELKALQELQSEAEGYSPDWKYGATLVRDSYFAEYTQEFLEDCGELPKNLPSYIVIDWEATAANVQADYTAVEFDGVTYWMR